MRLKTLNFAILFCLALYFSACSTEKALTPDFQATADISTIQIHPVDEEGRNLIEIPVTYFDGPDQLADSSFDIESEFSGDLLDLNPEEYYFLDENAAVIALFLTGMEDGETITIRIYKADGLVDSFTGTISFNETTSASLKSVTTNDTHDDDWLNIEPAELP